MKNNLLTIGDISKKTGCSIKSLRYYDSIGLLKPIYVDPNNNYRYYTFEQARGVEIIQLCIFLGIPLKEVKKLIIKDDNKMDYSDLIEYGRKLTMEKIVRLKYNLKFLDNLHDEIERANSYNHDDIKEFDISEKYYYTEPFFEDEMDQCYDKALDNLYKYAFDNNILLKHSYGMIINIKNNIISSKFIAIEVDEKHHNLENVIKIDRNKFLCKKTNEFNFNKICDMFSNINSKDKTIIINNVYSCDFSNPYFEVKCTLKK